MTASSWKAVESVNSILSFFIARKQHGCALLYLCADLSRCAMKYWVVRGFPSHSTEPVGLMPFRDCLNLNLAVPPSVANRLGEAIFGYLLAYASWVGNRNHVFKDEHILFRSINAFRLFPVENTRSERVNEALALLASFYGDHSNLDRAHSNWYGVYRPDVARDILRPAIRAWMMATLRWGREGWTDLTFDEAIEQGLYAPLRAPVAWYAEESPDLREFWNTTFLTEMSWAFGVEWGLLDFGRQVETDNMLRRFVGEVRKCALHTPVAQDFSR